MKAVCRLLLILCVAKSVRSEDEFAFSFQVYTVYTLKGYPHKRIHTKSLPLKLFATRLYFTFASYMILHLVESKPFTFSVYILFYEALEF